MGGPPLGGRGRLVQRRAHQRMLKAHRATLADQQPRGLGGLQVGGGKAVLRQRQGQHVRDGGVGRRDQQHRLAGGWRHRRDPSPERLFQPFPDAQRLDGEAASTERGQFQQGQRVARGLRDPPGQHLRRHAGCCAVRSSRAASGARPGTVCSGGASSSRFTSAGTSTAGRAVITTAIASACSRRAANTIASREGTSSHCPSSTATSSGCVAAAASRVRVAAATASRSPPAAGHRFQLQGTGQGLGLNGRKLAQQPGQRFQQPGQAGEGDLDLRLVALDLQDAKAVRAVGGEREQAGLPDAGLAAQQDHAGRFFPGARDEAPEQLALRGAADQHALILGAEPETLGAEPRDLPDSKAPLRS